MKTASQSAETVRSACSAGVSFISLQFDTREKQGQRFKGNSELVANLRILRESLKPLLSLPSGVS
jgi:hypothetical protein